MVFLNGRTLNLIEQYFLWTTATKIWGIWALFDRIELFFDRKSTTLSSLLYRRGFTKIGGPQWNGEKLSWELLMPPCTFSYSKLSIRLLFILVVSSASLKPRNIFSLNQRSAGKECNTHDFSMLTVIILQNFFWKLSKFLFQSWDEPIESSIIVFSYYFWVPSTLFYELNCSQWENKTVWSAITCLQLEAICYNHFVIPLYVEILIQQLVYLRKLRQLWLSLSVNDSDW